MKKKEFLVLMLSLFSATLVFSQAPTPPTNSYKNYMNIYPEVNKPRAFSFYNPNYFLVFDMPAKAQVSFKYNIAFDENAKDDSGFYFAYTFVSMLQLFEKKGPNNTSNPMVDTNFMPEGFYLFSPRTTIPWFSFQTGYKHQSNGAGGHEVRNSVAWDLLYVEPQFHAHFWNGYFQAKVRFWIPADISDNPDILDYFGIGELNLSYKTVFNNTVGFEVGLMLRKGMRSYYGAMALDIAIGPFFFSHYTVPVSVFLQIWSGYGETLRFYDKSYTKLRIGVGFPIW